MSTAERKLPDSAQPNDLGQAGNSSLPEKSSTRKDTRFKPGRSGNPRGRPKRVPVTDLRVVLERVLAEPAVIRERGRIYKVSKFEAMMHAQMLNGLKGNHKAVKKLVGIARKQKMFSRLDPHARPLGSNVWHKPYEGEKAKMLALHRAEREALARAAHDRGDDDDTTKHRS